jgi:hypothetical protein
MPPGYGVIFGFYGVFGRFIGQTVRPATERDWTTGG